MPKSTYVAVDNGRNGALNFRNFDLEFKVDNMNNKIQLKSRLGGTMLALGLLALSAPSMADESILDATTYCTSTGQICDQPFTFDVTTDTTLKIQYTVPETHCSSIRLNISVDGGLPITTDFLGWNGDEDVRPLDTGVIDLGPVSAGTHQVSLQAEGTEGGCNVGGVASWGGAVQIFAAVPPTAALPGIGGTLTNMSSIKGMVNCQNMKTKQKINFPLPVGARSWDCESEGLVVKPGNIVKQTISVTGRTD
ncbi:MAG: hypothetical protein NTY50_22620 [Methylobacter sp.]|nr:hypothetical protein [Methylobacter sp.]